MSSNAQKHRIQILIGSKSELAWADPDEFVIGRDAGVDVRIQHSDVSRKHLRVRIHEGNLHLEDLGSTNGTAIDGKLIPANRMTQVPPGSPAISIGKRIKLYITPASQVPSEEPAALSASERADTAPMDLGAERVEIERYKAEALASAEKIVAEARTQADIVLAELQLSMDRMQSEVSELDEKLQSILRECKLEEERADQLRTENSHLTEERSNREAGLVELQRAHDALAEKLGAERALLSKEHASHRDSLDLELEKRQKEIASALETHSLGLSRELEALDAEHGRALAERASRHERSINEVEREHESWLTELAVEKSARQSELEDLHAQRKAIAAELEAMLARAREAQATQARHTELAEIETRKQQALFTTSEAELKSRRLSIEASIGEIELKRIAADRELALLQTRNQEQQESIRTERERMEKAEVSAQSALRALEEKRLSATTDEERARATLAGIQSSISSAGTELKLLEQRASQARKDAESQEADVARQCERITAELAALKSSSELEMKARLQADFEAKAKELEKTLAQAKLTEMERIQQLLEGERRAERDRRHAKEDEIARRAIELSRQGPLSARENELRKAIRESLDGQTKATSSEQARERSRKFWRKTAVRAAIPAAAAILYAIFPNAPNRLRESFSRGLASHQDESGIFVAQIRSKGLKYEPETDSSYRSTYRENLLYLTGYAEMKLDENSQRDWTLALNRFLVAELGLSDQVVVDFVAAESVLVRELLKIREGILPQYKEQGLEKLTETERTEGERMLSILKTAENYRRFRDFERKTYEEHIERLAR